MIEEDINFFKNHHPHVNFKDYNGTPSQGTPIYSNNIGRDYPSASPQGFANVYGVGVGPATTFFKTSHFSTQQISDVQGGLQRIKNQQLEVLEELKQEHEQLRHMQRHQTLHTSSKVSQASSSSMASSSVQSSKQSSGNKTLQRRLEHQLNQKTRRIEELLMSERELQKTIHNLRSQIDRKSLEDPDLAATIKKLKVSEADLTQKYLREIESYKADTEKFILENTRLKKELLNKDFELKALIEEQARKPLTASTHHLDQSRAAREIAHQLREQEAEFNERIAWLEDQLQNKDSEIRRTQEQVKYLKDNAISESDFKRVKQQLEDEKLNALIKATENKKLEDQISGLIAQVALGKTSEKEENLTLREEIQSLRQLISEKNNNNTTSNPELQSKIQHLTKDVEELTLMLKNRDSTHTGELESLRKELEASKNKLSECTKYIAELEEAVSNVQPVRPGIFGGEDWQAREKQLNDTIANYKQAEADWNNRVVQYEEKVYHLESQYDDLKSQVDRYRNNDRATIEEYENKINTLEQSWGRKEVEYEEKILKLEEQIKSKYEGQIDSLKLYIQQVVDSGAEDLKLKTSEFETQMNNLKLMNSKNAENLQQEFKAQLDKLSNLHKQTESQKRAYMDEVGQLQVQVGTLTRELSTLRSGKNTFEAEIARLGQDNAEWKRRFEQDIRKVAIEKDEFAKLQMEKYEKDMAALKSMNQRLLQENQQIIPLQGQLQQLVGMNRQLHSQVRERSQAIDHLWQVKLAEYDNIQNQINRLKARVPAPIL